LADQFSSEPLPGDVYVKFSGSQLQNAQVMRQLKKIWQQARLTYLDISDLAREQNAGGKLMTRVSETLSRLLKDVPPSEPVEVLVSLETHPASQEPELQVVCTNSEHSLLAVARLGVVADTTEEQVLPREEMAHLAASVQTALSELWPSRRLSAATLQRRLEELDCEIDSSLALDFERKQLRRDTLMTRREIRDLILSAVMDEKEPFVVRTGEGVRPYRISLMTQLNYPKFGS